LFVCFRRNRVSFFTGFLSPCLARYIFFFSSPLRHHPPSAGDIVRRQEFFTPGGCSLLPDVCGFTTPVLLQVAGSSLLLVSIVSSAKAFFVACFSSPVFFTPMCALPLDFSCCLQNGFIMFFFKDATASVKMLYDQRYFHTAFSLQSA